MNLFRWPCVSVINTASILRYIMISCRTFIICWNTCFLNYFCKTWPHGRHFVDSSIALFSKSLTLPNINAFIISKVLIALMGFSRLCAAFYTQTAHERISSKLNDIRHAWYVFSQCSPYHTGGLMGCLEFPSHRVLWGSFIGCNSKYTAIGKLKTIKIFLQISG